MSRIYTGVEIKKEILDSGVRLWKVADKLGISDFTFSRKLRHDFSDAEHERIAAAIAEILSAK